MLCREVRKIVRIILTNYIVGISYS